MIMNMSGIGYNMVNLHYYVIEIRKLAAEYQCGGNLTDLKKKVDTLIRSLSEEVSEDKTTQAEVWNMMLTTLERYFNCKAHPRWETIISHAKMRVKTRKRSALTGCPPLR